MKKFYKYTTLLILTISLVVLFGSSFFKSNEEQTSESVFKYSTPFIYKVKDIIKSKELSGSKFTEINLFEISKETNSKALNEFVNNGVFLDIKKDALSKLLDESYQTIDLVIPDNDNKKIELLLSKVNVLSRDFKMYSKTSAGIVEVPFKDGLHYQGIIKDNQNSLAAVSIFSEHVMIVFSDGATNYTAGAIKNESKRYTDNYILYKESDLKKALDFICGVEQHEDKLLRKSKPVFEDKINPRNYNPMGSRDSIRVYFECDYQMYVDFGNSTSAVGQYVSGFFNAVKTLYQNESIPFLISETAVWTQNDPYSGYYDSYTILLKFSANTQDNFYGDIAHFLTTRPEGMGGIANIRTLCQPYNSTDTSGRFCFSNIETSYNQYPVYSWTVMVTTHEMGHVVGSRHTHACVWDLGYGIGPIDTCVVTPENSYYSGYGGCVMIYPSNSCVRSRMGTIMSYCHFCENQGGGISLTNGFGQLPGDTIRLRYSQAKCFDQILNSSEQPVTFDLMQNYPNPFNPATNIIFALVGEGYVTLEIFDITGRNIGTVIDEQFYPVGFHKYFFEANDYNLASGTYFYRLTVKQNNQKVFSEIKKMILIK